MRLCGWGGEPPSTAPGKVDAVDLSGMFQGRALGWSGDGPNRFFWYKWDAVDVEKASIEDVATVRDMLTEWIREQGLEGAS